MRLVTLLFAGPVEGGLLERRQRPQHRRPRLRRQLGRQPERALGVGPVPHRPFPVDPGVAGLGVAPARQLHLAAGVLQLLQPVALGHPQQAVLGRRIGRHRLGQRLGLLPRQITGPGLGFHLRTLGDLLGRLQRAPSPHPPTTSSPAPTNPRPTDGPGASTPPTRPPAWPPTSAPSTPGSRSPSRHARPPRPPTSTTRARRTTSANAVNSVRKPAKVAIHPTLPANRCACNPYHCDYCHVDSSAPAHGVQPGCRPAACSSAIQAMRPSTSPSSAPPAVDT